MDAQIEEFNWNLRHFLDVLGTFQEKVNKANPTSLELLEQTLDKIGNLIENVEEVGADHNGDAIAFSIDPTQFEVKQTIFCRLCKVNVTATRIGYMLHASEAEHQRNLLEFLKIGENGQSVFDSNNNTKNNVNKADSLVNSKRGTGKFEEITNEWPKNVKELNEKLKIQQKKMDEVGVTFDNVFANEKMGNSNGNANGNYNKIANEPEKKKTSTPKVMPNLFDDDFFEFLTATQPSVADETNKYKAPMIGAAKYSPTKNAPSANGNGSPGRQNTALSWRERPKENVQEVPLFSWRTNKGAAAIVVPTSANMAASTSTQARVQVPAYASVHATHAPVQTPEALASATPKAAEPEVKKLTEVTESAESFAKSARWRVFSQDHPPIPNPITDSIVQNGAVLTGGDMKPCPTYELNNLYATFPHLNPNKVPNPLKPVPMHEIPSLSNAKAQSNNKTSGLQNLFDKVNAKNAEEQKRVSQMKRSGISGSLVSLTRQNAFLSTADPRSAQSNGKNGTSAHRMPGRSATSISLVGFPRSTAANEAKKSRKSPETQNGQKSNGRAQASPANGNNTPRGLQNRNTVSTSNLSEIGRSKGAIPKQNVKTVQSNTSGTASGSQVGEIPRAMNKPEPIMECDEEKLTKLFSGDLSAVINWMVDLNSRSELAATQKKVIDSIESLIKDNFKTAKGHLIGSHAYRIAKGGRATFDVYLDLHDSFHVDKSGPVFVSGMTDTLKLMQQHSDWLEPKCSEQTRYAILSAIHKPLGLKCHFTFGTGVGVRNKDVINSLFSAQPVARQLVLSVRLALQEGATGNWAQYFTGYVVSLLVIFFLQVTSRLPSVLSLQSEPNLTFEKCGENIVHYKDPAKVPICKDRIRDLLIGFFDYYEKFNFFNKIISPFEGREINSNFRKCDGDSLSRSMRRFKSFVDVEPQRWTNNKMCVQDIFEHKRNVTQLIHTNEVKAFKHFCGKALAIIHAVGSSVKY